MSPRCRRHERFRPRGVARRPQGHRRRGQELGARLDDGLFCLRVRAGLRVRLRRGRAGRGERRRGHSVDRDRVLGDAGPDPDVRARTADRDSARAPARAGGSAGAVCGQARRHPHADGDHRGDSRAARLAFLPGANLEPSGVVLRLADGGHARLRGGRHALRRDARARAQPRHHAADSAVSGHGSRDHCRRSRHGSADAIDARRRGGSVLARTARLLRHRVRDAGALDLRASLDRIRTRGRQSTVHGPQWTVDRRPLTVNRKPRRSLMRNYSIPLLGVALLIFATAPVAIYLAPYESTMGLVQKIFYYHVPGALLMLALAMIGGVASAIFRFTGNPRADRWALAAVEQVVLFGAMTLVTGPLWARKAWGVWWEWEPRLTSTLLGWMVCLAYLLLRRFGGPGSD